MKIRLLTISFFSMIVRMDNNMKKEEKYKDVLTLENFSTFPPEIDGCSCYFSKDSTDFAKEQYIFANDFAETSFLKINGKFIKWLNKEKGLFKM